MDQKKIVISEPFLPPLDEVVSYLARVWDNKWVTNNGEFHKELESILSDYLGVPYISLFTNCTLALISAIKVAGFKKKVITTPLSFVATSHALALFGIDPVCVDIDPITLNLDPNKVLNAINDDVTGILPVHCYGNPCDVDAFDSISKKYNLDIVYDAAHAFGVQCHCGSLLNHGRFSVISFHATKVFNTFEGGAIISQTLEDKIAVDRFKNFSFVDELNVNDVGINAKMSEFNSALGIVQLKYIDDVINKRRVISELYHTFLIQSSLLVPVDFSASILHNFSYFPVICIDNQTREALFKHLISNNVCIRRYFYPLISNLEPYRDLPSSAISNLPIANKVSSNILCLPIHSGMSFSDVQYISNLILSFK